VFVTINFTTLGIADETGAGRLFSLLRTRIKRAWKYQRDGRCLKIGPFDDVGSHENPDGVRHVHWLVRVPAHIRPWFEASVEKQLKKIVGLDDLGPALHFKDIDAIGTLAKYILKGVRPDLADYFHMEAADQGIVLGRRVFVSRTIGHSARKAASWRRKRRPKMQGGVAIAQSH